MTTHCAVIAQGYPRADNGFGIAMLSSLRIYRRAFERVTYVCITDERPPPELAVEFPGVTFQHLPIRRRGYAARFLRSTLGDLPACVMHMHSGALRAALVATLRRELREARNAVLIVENIAPSIFVPLLRKEFAHARVVYRSHDVSELAFAPFAQTGSLPLRAAWRWEVARIHRLEARTLRLTDGFWTITSDDAREFARLHGRSSDGVVGAQIDVGRYADVVPGARERILYLGSTDARKAAGLHRFVSECWPVMLARHPQLELCIGGVGTESFARSGPNIRAMGRVDDERAFLGLGRTVLNPQTAGTGVKLKSLVALAAGKLLISTGNGLTGLTGAEAGKHFLAAASWAEMIDHFDVLFDDPARAESIAGQGRNYVRARYDIADVATHDRHFAEALARVGCRN